MQDAKCRGAEPRETRNSEKGGTEIDGCFFCKTVVVVFSFLGDKKMGLNLERGFFLVRNHESVPHFFSCCNYDMTFDSYLLCHEKTIDFQDDPQKCWEPEIRILSNSTDKNTSL